MAIPNARLVEFPGFGHAPQIQAPEDFNKALIAGLKAQAANEFGVAESPCARG